MSVGPDAPIGGAGLPPRRPPANERVVVRLHPSERWFPEEVVAIEARVSGSLLPTRVLVVDVTLRRAGVDEVLSRSFPCIPAYACYRDLCWWLRTLPSPDAEFEDRIAEWSAVAAERVADAAQDA